MALPSTPNKTTPTALKKGDAGWPVYGLQTGLDTIGYNLAFDGDFGPATDEAVRMFQRDNFLTADGIAGVNTQARLIKLLDTRTHNRHADLPDGLLRGFADSESGNKLGAVNWNVSGGVDCGAVQIRCYGPPYVMDELRKAYNPAVALEVLANRFLLDPQYGVNALHRRAFANRASIEFVERCTALAWNWPSAAIQYANSGKLTSPNNDATWAVIEGKRVKFPDGQPVMTWKDWSEFYALGGKHGEGKVTRFVRW
jgi:Putative peptidoglycan binding domain